MNIYAIKQQLKENGWTVSDEIPEAVFNNHSLSNIIQVQGKEEKIVADIMQQIKPQYIIFSFIPRINNILLVYYLKV